MPAVELRVPLCPNCGNRAEWPKGMGLRDLIRYPGQVYGSECEQCQTRFTAMFAVKQLERQP